jgi:hypothetical protein
LGIEEDELSLVMAVTSFVANDKQINQQIKKLRRDAV